MTILSASVIALGAAALTLYLRNQQKEVASLICISASLVLFSGIISETGEIFDELQNASAGFRNSELASVLIKALGIAAATQITADVCREAGSPSLASQVEMFGKLEIVLLSLPLVARLIGFAGELLP